MSSSRIFLSTLLALTTVSCSSHNLKGAAPETVPLQEARIFQPDRFAKGGKLLVAPFSAGEDVAAGDDLDRVSLRIVKGIADVLGEQARPFQLLVDKDAQNAHVVIKGRVTAMTKVKKVKGLPGKPRFFSLAVEGSLLDVETDEVIAKFFKDTRSSNRDDSFEAMGYRIGVEIGRFLLKDPGKGE